jgi:hypothetical protein
MGGRVNGDDCIHCGSQLDGFDQCMSCDTYGTPADQRADTTEKVLVLIAAERVKQFNKWGEQNHSPALWYAILGEEFGEVGKEICEAEAEFSRGDDYSGRGHLLRLKTELVHLLAVGTAMLESLERNQGVPL